MGNNIGSIANGSHFKWDRDGNVIWVKDLDKGDMSVTNNIDRVLEYLNEHLPVK